MIQPETLAVLEFDRIQASLETRALTPMGRELALELVPAGSRIEADRRQDHTAEAVIAVDRGLGRIPAVSDIRRLVGRARRGGVLDPAELLEVLRLLAVAGSLRREFTRQENMPLLAALASELEPASDLVRSIDRTVTDSGEIRDDASPDLARIRRQLRVLRQRVRERMEELARSPGLRDILQEPVVMLREDRYVLPVKQERRGKVKGIIHDRSASGATLFIEPLAVLGMNNTIRRRVLEERAEVERLLRDLSGWLAAIADDLDRTTELVGEIDCRLAAGRLASDLHCIRPRLNETGNIDIRQGRHPLLGRGAVPVDIRLGRAHRVLVITGPNTGGKTVALKTVGLFTLMAQAGLQVPAAPDTDLSVFDAITCDIGDEQSIERSLSTFSSHLRNVVTVVKEAGAGHLVLLDEIGVGTDPRQGASLAIAVLEHLAGTGARVVVTTHYDELKMFAFEHEHMENAAVEFDHETLEPSYRLVMGVPGASWAHEIAERLGMPSAVVDRARSLLDEGSLRVDALIRELEEQRRSLEHELEQARRLKSDAETVARRLEQEREQYRQKTGRTLDDIRGEARRLMREQKQRYGQVIEDAVNRFDRLASEAARREADRVTTSTREQMSAIDRELMGQFADADEDVPAGTALTPRTARPGQSVVVAGTGAVGRILDLENDTAVVETGSVRVKVPVSRLQPGPEPRPVQADNVGGISLVKARSVPVELMLRGLIVDDALTLLDSYLDDAVLAGHGQVRIIHGKGTGALRQAVRRALGEHPRVVEFRPGHPEEGGDGATIARLQ